MRGFPSRPVPSRVASAPVDDAFGFALGARNASGVMHPDLCRDGVGNERERRKALQDLRIEAADLALTVAEKVLERSLSEDDHRRLAREAGQAVSAGESQK